MHAPLKLFLSCLFLCVHVSVCMCMHVYAHAPRHARRVKGQLVEVDYVFPPCGSWGSDSGSQAWGQTPLPAEPSDQPESIQSLQGLCVFCV